MEPVLNEEPVFNDSLDDFIALSQAANLDIGQNLEDSDLEEDGEDGGDLGQDNQDSFDDLMSQLDDNDYLRMGQPSAKSKVEKPSKKIQMARKKSEADFEQDNR